MKATGPAPRVARLGRVLITAVLAAAALGAMPPRVSAIGEADVSEARAVRIELRERDADLKVLYQMRLDLDGVFDGWARAYVTQEERIKLERLGFAVTTLPDEGKIGLERMKEEGTASGVGPRAAPSLYHTYATLTSDLQAIAAAHPEITRLTSIGQSVQGRELWIMKITDNPDLEEDEPEVAYIAAMHGDEVVGKELCFNLINYLTDGYAIDPRVQDLVDDTEIWILPSMNPDGTELGQRNNANGPFGVDLNRNFPDYFSDPVNTPDGREPETQAVMAWGFAHSTNLSANFHGGALVVNYPWDNNPSGASVFSPTPDPDHPALESVSLTYAESNPPMYASPSFPNGVTNGADWYAIDGGMQDWNYAYLGDFQVTIELGSDKWPPASQLTTFWNENHESMLSYFERVHEGIRGVVTDDATGAPLAATIHIDSDPFPGYTDPDVGDYHKILLPGTYTAQVSAPGYIPQTFPVSVGSGPAARYDVELLLSPPDLQPVASQVEDGAGGNDALDAGETADLAVTLENGGRGATAVAATLVPTGWFADVPRAEAGYPDIPQLGSAESAPPHFQVHVDSAVPPGHKLGFALEWSAGEGSGTSEPFFLPVGGESCDTHPSADVPKAILDYQTTTSQLTVPANMEIADVRVTVDITHTYIGDLEVELGSPSGTTVLLHDRTGSGTDDIVGTYGVDLTPAEPLSVLAGEPAAGNWQLTVRDQAGGDTGSLNDWSIEICGGAFEASTPEMRLRDLSVEAGGARVRWWPYPGLDSYRVYRATDPSSPGAFSDVTAEDPDPTDTGFLDASAEPMVFYMVTGVGPLGEGPKGHFGQ